MIEGLPWSAWVGVASSGWILTSGFIWALISGRLVTKREADVYVKRAEVAEDISTKAVSQNAEMIAWAELGKSTFTALRDAAQKDSR